MRYIKPVETIRCRLPRKMKKKYIKDFGREWYYDLIHGDLYEEDGWFKIIFTDAWEREMKEREIKHRKMKLNKILCSE